MRRFARLYTALDETTRTNDKVAAMAAYFGAAPAADAAWAVWFLSGGRFRRLVPVRRLASWAMDAADVPEWLFDECYHAVGDLAETIALLLPPVDNFAGLRRIDGRRGAGADGRLATLGLHHVAFQQLAPYDVALSHS